MFDVTLNKPKAKKRRKSEELKQPLPVPIATITGIKANDSLWRFYHGKLDLEKNIVLVEDPQEATFLGIWGFFGSRGNPNVPRKTAKRAKSTGNALVILEDFEPTLSTIKHTGANIKEADLSSATASESCQENVNEDSDVEEICVEDSGAVDADATADATADAADDVVAETEQTLQLSSVEAFFLAFGLGCLLVQSPRASFVEDPELSIDDLWRIFCAYDKDFPYQYAVYHHFRAKGYVVKEGTKFGCDFLVYKEGPPFYHAQYSVRIMLPHQPAKWRFISGLNRVNESAGKELLLAQISEYDNAEQESSEKIINTNQAVKQKLKNIGIKEVLLRRWVPSQERGISPTSEQQIKLDEHWKETEI